MFFMTQRRRPRSTLFPYTTLFRSFSFCIDSTRGPGGRRLLSRGTDNLVEGFQAGCFASSTKSDRKSTRLNSSHRCISYAVFCLKKKTVVLESDARTTPDDGRVLPR